MFKFDWEPSGPLQVDNTSVKLSGNKKRKQKSKKKKSPSKTPSTDLNSSAIEAALESANRKLNLFSESEQKTKSNQRVTQKEIEAIINPSRPPPLKSVLKTPLSKKKNGTKRLSVTFDDPPDDANDSKPKKKTKKIKQKKKETSDDHSNKAFVNKTVNLESSKVDPMPKLVKLKDNKKENNNPSKNFVEKMTNLQSKVDNANSHEKKKKRKLELTSSDTKIEPVPKLVKLNDNPKKNGIQSKKNVSYLNKNDDKTESNSNNDSDKKTTFLENSDDENWEDLSDCSDSEVEFDEGSGDDGSVEAIKKDVEAFMAGLDFKGARKRMLEDKKNEDLEDEQEDLEDEQEEDLEDEQEEDLEDEQESEMEEDSNSESNDGERSSDEKGTKTLNIKSSKINDNVKQKIHISADISNAIKSSLAKFNTNEIALKPTKPKTMDEKLNAKLNAAKFRMINEQLYTMPGKEAFKMFKEDPESFKVYHDGFKIQVSLWPLNPLDVIAEWLKSQNKAWMVADFGCGEGELSQRVDQKVHSFDLVASRPHITACDMAKVPLGPQSINVAVFCLSLMGTNVSDFIKEANRVLKNGGIMKVAEVKSRITSMDEFVGNVQKFGFKLFKKPLDHKYFVSFDFKKFRNIKNKELPTLKLKPCVYKRR